MLSAIHTSLEVTVCADADDAIAKGFFNYAQRGVRPIAVKKVAVVQKGTVSGGSTVDFVLEDDTGQQFVFMVTGRLLKSIPC